MKAKDKNYDKSIYKKLIDMFKYTKDNYINIRRPWKK